MNKTHVTDRNIESLVSNLLRIGVLLSAAVVLAGGAVYLFRHAGEAADFHSFHKLAQSDRSIPQIVLYAAHFKTRSVIQFGILLLLLTPVARVAFSLVGFALEGDRNYVVVTAIVLTTLLYSLISGAMGIA